MREQRFERLHQPNHPKNISDSMILRHGICFGLSAHLPRHVEPQLLELISKPLFPDVVQFVEGEGGGGAAQRDAAALDAEDGFVEVFLRGVEGAGYGPGAGDVGDVAAVFLWLCVSA